MPWVSLLPLLPLQGDKEKIARKKARQPRAFHNCAMCRPTSKLSLGLKECDLLTPSDAGRLTQVSNITTVSNVDIYMYIT